MQKRLRAVAAQEVEEGAQLRVGSALPVLGKFCEGLPETVGSPLLPACSCSMLDHAVLALDAR